MREGIKPDVVLSRTADGVVIDGTAGEGGAQILRSSLTLSMLTGLAVRIEGIRAARPRSGLMRQHLTCVIAATEVCNATCDGAALGATSLAFTPDTPRPGTYNFSVAGAGSSGFVFQTILPALMVAEGPSSLTLQGGTHNAWAPPFHYLRDVFAPALARFGPTLDLSLERAGFQPAGGGCWHAHVAPVASLTPVEFVERGKRLERRFEVLRAGLPGHVGARELQTGAKLLSWPTDCFADTCLSPDEGPGNVVMAFVRFEHVSEMSVSFGNIKTRAEQVAKQAARPLRKYLASNAVVGEYLCDQLLLPMAMARGTVLVTEFPSKHALTQMAVIEAFLPVKFRVTVDERLCRIDVEDCPARE